MGLKVIDNFLPQELFDSLKQAVQSSDQLWYLHTDISTNMFKVIDDFLPKQQYDGLKEFIDSPNQSWFPYEKIDHELVNVSKVDKRKHYGFSCNVVKYEAPYMYQRLPCTGLVYAFHQKIKDDLSIFLESHNIKDVHVINYDLYDFKFVIKDLYQVH